MILADLEAACISRFLCIKQLESLDDVVHEITGLPPWDGTFQGFSAVKRSRLRKRVAEDIMNHLAIIVVRDLGLGSWFMTRD